MRHHSISRAARIRSLALACTGIIAVAPSIALADSASTAIVIGEPDGFSYLTGTQELLVDVYFGGIRRGTMRVAASPTKLEIRDLDKLETMLGFVPSQAVLLALSAPNLSPNASLICGEMSDRSRCGSLNPEVAGVILDRDNLRLDIFLNPRFLTERKEKGEAWLPIPDDTVTFVDSFSGLVSGQSGNARTYYTLQNNLVVGSGERRGRANLSYANSQGLTVDTLALEWDMRGLRYHAGAIWAPGNELDSRQKILGIGLETQIDTRADRELLLASPLIIYLDRRSRVDIFRDEHLVHSAIYEAGNQQIDTSALPDGAYSITVRIQEPGRPPREERQFFSKSRRVPSLGRTDFNALAGLEIEGAGQGSILPSRRPFLRASVARRFSREIAFDGSLKASTAASTLQAAVVFISPIAQLRVATIASSHGDLGGVVQLNSTGASRLNFSFDLRRVSGDFADSRTNSSFPARQRDLVSQASGIVSFGLDGFRFLGTGYYRREDNESTQYSIGPAIEWDILRKGAATLTLRSDATITDSGTAGFLGLSVRLRGARGSASMLAGVRYATDKNDPIGSGSIISLGGNWSPQTPRGELSIGSGLERQVNQTVALMSADYRGPFGALGTDLTYNDTPNAQNIQYSVGLQTTMAGGYGKVAFAGRTTSESMITARVNGARPDDKFELLIDEHVAGIIEGEKAFSAFLPAYRAYDLRIRSVGRNLVSYETATRHVGLYPGTVASTEWRVAPMQLQFGRLLDLEGEPLAGSSIIATSTWAETDEEGFFELETTTGAEVVVLTRTGDSFHLTLPQRSGNVARLGEMRCCSVPPSRMAAAVLSDIPERGR